MLTQSKLDIQTQGRRLLDITNEITKVVLSSQTNVGLCHIFLHHTSASLILCENADPLVQRDLENFMGRFVLDGDTHFQHTSEGPDDMSSHVRTVFTTSFLTIPITANKLALGTWQGIYLWEHRFRGHHRKLTVTIYGN